MFRVLFLTFILLSARAQASVDLELAAQYQETYAEGLLRSADITLVGLANLFEFSENNSINDLIIHNSLNRTVKRVPGLRALFTTTVDGKLQYDSFRYPTRNMNLKDRAYVREAFGLKENELYIGKPIRNTFANFDSLPLSRPIFSEKGYIKGVAVAIMTPDHLIKRDKVCVKCVVSIYKTTGEKVTSFPSSFVDFPDVQSLMSNYKPNVTFKIDINRLSTQSLWIPFNDYELVLVYSYFE